MITPGPCHDWHTIAQEIKPRGKTAALHRAPTFDWEHHVLTATQIVNSTWPYIRSQFKSNFSRCIYPGLFFSHYLLENGNSSDWRKHVRNQTPAASNSKWFEMLRKPWTNQPRALAKQKQNCPSAACRFSSN